MNKIEYMIFKNKLLQKLDRESRRHINCIRFSSAESKKHIFEKVNILIRTKHEFLTEIYDKTRKHRADILLFTYPKATVIEVINSESEESIKRKEVFWNKLDIEFEIKRVM